MKEASVDISDYSRDYIMKYEQYFDFREPIRESDWEDIVDKLEDLKKYQSYVKDSISNYKATIKKDSIKTAETIFENDLENGTDIRTVLENDNKHDSYDLYVLYFVQEYVERLIDYFKHTQKSFSSRKCLRNVRMLCKAYNVNISKLETAAGLSQGITSRYEKDGYRYEPTAEYLTTCAKIFNVSLDDLVYSNFSGYSEEEQFIYKFITKMTHDTKKGRLNWEKCNFFYDPDTREDPNFEFAPGIYEEYFDNESGSMKYGILSPFVKDAVDFEGECLYRANILDGRNTFVYFIPCIYNKEYFIEMYFVEDKKKRPICNTKEVCMATKSSIMRLFELVKEDSDKVHIDHETKDLMNYYLKH